MWSALSKLYMTTFEQCDFNPTTRNRDNYLWNQGKTSLGISSFHGMPELGQIRQERNQQSSGLFLQDVRLR